MKRTPLLILGLLFLILCVACLFYRNYSGNLLLALVVALFFFIRFAITKESRAIPEPRNIVTVPAQQSEERETEYEYEKEARYEMETARAEVHEHI